jgi:N-dimethylarginine dimethylaminohydrolase
MASKRYYDQLDFPVFLMDEPNNYHVAVANNVWVKKLSPADRKVDKAKATKQWLALYNYLASEAYVITLPEFNADLQDQVFVANLGVGGDAVREGVLRSVLARRCGVPLQV